MPRPMAECYCPFCRRESAFVSTTARGKPTFYCRWCKTRVFINNNEALEGLGDLCNDERAFDDIMPHPILG